MNPLTLSSSKITLILRTSLIAMAVALACHTWSQWGNFQVDCGRELYVPQQIARGKLLYRDLWYAYGPLEPYVAAGLFRIFGESFNTLFSFGLVLAATNALLLLELGTLIESRLIGFSAAFLFLLQGFRPTIFNYMFPYSYGAVLGLFLGLVCLLSLTRHILGRPGRNLLLAGFAAGLSICSKPEFGVACFAMIGVMMALQLRLKSSARALIRELCEVTVPALLTVAIGYGWFFWKLGPAFIFANWAGPHNSYLRDYAPHLYAFAGLNFEPSSMLWLAARAVVAVLLWMGLARFLSIAARRSLSVALILPVLFATLLKLTHNPVLMTAITEWFAFPPGMFYLGCGFVIYAVYQWYTKKDPSRLAEVTLGIFALSASSRILTFISPFGYSVFYHVPLLLVFSTLLAKAISYAATPFAERERQYLVGTLLLVDALIVACLTVPARGELPARLATSWGTLSLNTEDAPIAHDILAFVSKQREVGNRVELLPELPIVYALTDTQSASRFYTLQPGILGPQEEDEYIRDFRRANPAYVVLTNRNTAEYGAPYFGIDYNQKIYAWVMANYCATREFGHFKRDGSHQLSALLLQRRDLGMEACVAGLAQ